MTVWKPLSNDKFGLIKSVNDFILKLEINREISFPNFLKTEKLYFFSDYGGEHKDADFISYAFLITDLESVLNFTYYHPQLLDSLNLSNRIISYKKLNDKLRMKALYPFLEFSNNINGIIFVLLVEKSISTLFESQFQKERLNDYSKWKSFDFEKLMRVIHFISLFISGLSQPMQDICWISDEDNIVVNDEKLITITEMLANVSSHYLTHSLNKLQCGRANIEIGKNFEALCSIPDLCAGAITDLLTYYSSNDIFPDSKVIVPTKKDTKTKINQIIYWFMNNNHNLKKVCFSITDDKSDRYILSHLRFHNLYNYLGL
ncbi:MAG: hypothetical protein LUM44_09865 [Pyrinomonadaceae bacterium]|nr:hypothetical protein [Pyrinomonadaceae bacterium]